MPPFNKQQKQSKGQVNKKSNPIAEKGKKDWIKLCSKQNDPNARERQAQRLFALMKGSIPECCMQHEVCFYCFLFKLVFYVYFV